MSCQVGPDMTRSPLRLAPLLLVALAACGPDPVRLAVPPASAAERIASSFATIEVLAVSLPAYGEDDAVFLQAGGAIAATKGVVWADDPPRAVTLDLVRALSETTGARVAPEPWPFEERAEARLDVRVAEIVADASGAFLMRGVYYVASQDGTGRDASREFAISIPFDPEGGAGAIAAARGQATLALAREIASDGL